VSVSTLLACVASMSGEVSNMLLCGRYCVAMCFPCIQSCCLFMVVIGVLGGC